MTTTKITLGTWLHDLSSGESMGSDRDWLGMQRLLRFMDFPKARVVYGIVYLEGQGTLHAPPTPINQVAGQLYKALLHSNAEMLRMEVN